MAVAELDERIAARKELIQPGGKMHTHFGVIDKLLANSNTKFYLSDDMGLADASVFVAACMLAGGYASLLLPLHACVCRTTLW